MALALTGAVVWMRVDALPSGSPPSLAGLAQPATDSELLRERVVGLLASLVTGESLIAQVALSPGAARLGIGLAGSGSEDARNRLMQALDGLVTLTEGAPEALSGVSSTLTPTASRTPPIAVLPWPANGIDVDSLLSVAHQLSGSATIAIFLRSRPGAVQAVGLHRRLARREQRGPLPAVLEELRDAAAAREQTFDVRVELVVTDLRDLDRIRRAMMPGVVLASESVSARGDYSEVDGVMRGDIVFARHAAGLVPLDSLPGASLAPIARRAALLGGVRPAESGQLVLGTGRGGIEVGIPRDDVYQHLAVYGRTGFGKTTAMHGLLRQLNDAGMPFLVVDPLKDDYEPLLAELSDRGEIGFWDVGAHGTAPVNLLAPPPGVDPLSYAGLFAGAFAQAARLEEFPLAVSALRSSLERLYSRHLAQGRDGYPTLAELYDEVQRSGQTADPRSRGAAEAAVSLKSRLSALVAGRSGHSLLGGANDGLDWDSLTAKPTLVSLRSFVDPEARNSVFALLLASFIAYRTRNAPSRGHVLVLEEAHALFPDADSAEDGLLSVQLASAIAMMRSRRQGFVLVTQSPTQLPARVRDLLATRLALRVDDPASALLAPNRLDLQGQLVALGKGEAALWSASGDPQATFLRTSPPAVQNMSLSLPRQQRTTPRYELFTDVALLAAVEDDYARRVGAAMAPRIAPGGTDDVGLILTDAVRFTNDAMRTAPASISPADRVAHAILARALSVRLAHDPVLHAYAQERAASITFARPDPSRKN